MAIQYSLETGEIRAIGSSVGQHIGYIDNIPEERDCIDEGEVSPFNMDEYYVDISQIPHSIRKKS